MSNDKVDETQAPKRGRRPRPLAQNVLQIFQNDAAQAGSRYSERDLAHRLGVSRTPVRAALHELSQQGLVQLDPGRGWTLLREPGPSAPIPEADFSQELTFKLCRDRYRGLLGETITESELLKRYEVTKAELSRALVELTGDGLLERTPGYGWRFLPMLTDESAKRHSYDVRLAIETASLLSDDFAIDKERLQRARAEHQSLLDGEIRTAPARKLFEVNAAFHLMLVAFSQNPYFLQITKQQNQLRQVIEYFTHVNRDRMAQSCREHLMIIDALEQGDRYWAASLLERHLKSAKYRLS